MSSDRPLTSEQSTSHLTIKAALVRAILEQWRSYTWTVQGFGFIRTKLAKVGRIHVWDSSLAPGLRVWC